MHGTPKDRTRINEIYKELDKIRDAFDNPKPHGPMEFTTMNMAAVLELQERQYVLELGKIMGAHILENQN